MFSSEYLNRNDFHTEIGNRYGKLSFIKSGFLWIYRQTDKKEITQWISSPGEFVTDLNSLMFDQTSRWNIQALTDCELYTMEYPVYKNIHQHIPNWSEIEKLFIAKCFMTLEDRVFSFLSMSSEERYEFLTRSKPELLQHIPLQYLASMLGMTPETLSRIRKKIIS
ncbi:MAG: Crp/Fnr family transcriptional regulator [Crocinitomicaceae bacterium]